MPALILRTHLSLVCWKVTLVLLYIETQYYHRYYYSLLITFATGTHVVQAGLTSSTAVQDGLELLILLPHF